MAGGTFLTMNKKLPGAYINFKSVPAPTAIMGSRGIATMPVSLSWANEGELVELFSTDLLDGRSITKIGLSAFDAESLVLRECLKNCYKLLLYPINTGAAKASATVGGLTITSKKAGLLGNQIKIVIKKNKTDYDVVTLFKTNQYDLQTIKSLNELQENDFVVFTGEGVVTPTAGTNLENGTDGTVSKATYTKYFDLMKTKSWQVMGIPSTDSSIPPLATEYIKTLRDKLGKKVQCVVYDYVEANHEGVISCKQGYKTKTETIEKEIFVAYITGATAGANINQSNCYKIIDGATEIIGDLPEDELEAELEKGYFLLTKRVDGKIVILDDNNTFTEFTPEKDRDFANNRSIRVFDEIANTTRLIFEKYYAGKVDNIDTGRDVFKAQLIANARQLQDINAIQNFSAEDIVVIQGQEKEDVKVDMNIQTVDSMKKLYMTVFER